MKMTREVEKISKNRPPADHQDYIRISLLKPCWKHHQNWPWEFQKSKMMGGCSFAVNFVSCQSRSPSRPRKSQTFRCAHLEGTKITSWCIFSSILSRNSDLCGGQAQLGLISCHITATFPGWEQDFQHCFAFKACTFCLNVSVEPRNVVTVL